MGVDGATREQTGSRLKLRGVTRAYQTPAGPTFTALDGLDLDVFAGEVLAVCGPSGSGKSTLLHLIGAMDAVDTGEVIVDDVDIAQLRESRLVAYRRTVGFVFQRFHLLPALSALDNVIAPVLPYRTSYNKRERATELLAAVGLEHRADHPPTRISGGEQQRVAIARALVNRPRLLLADEPTGNLDSQTGSQILDLLLGLRDQYGLTMLIATHDPAIASRCDRVLRLRDGKVDGHAASRDPDRIQPWTARDGGPGPRCPKPGQG